MSSGSFVASLAGTDSARAPARTEEKRRKAVVAFMLTEQKKLELNQNHASQSVRYGIFYRWFPSQRPRVRGIKPIWTWRSSLEYEGRVLKFPMRLGGFQ